MILYGIFYFVKQLLGLAAPWCYLLFLEQVITKGRTELLLPIFSAYLGLYVLQTGAEVILRFINRNLIAFKDVVLTKIGVYLLGGLLVMGGYSSVAVLLTFMEYFSSMMDTVMSMMDQYILLGEQEPSVKRVKQWEEQVPLNPSLHSGAGCCFDRLECDHVTFAYGEMAEPELSDISFCLRSGEVLAVLGKSGCGKSTLARLLVGLELPGKGQVLYQGRPVTDYEEEEFFERVGIVMQDSWLFHLTIRENLLIGTREEAAEEMLWNACEKANLAEFIRTLPQGLDTLIGENGIRLSGGQRQRLVLARMFLHNPRVLILDEAFSGLDVENERQILDRLLGEAEDRIVIMITHRREALAGWDRIVRLELG